MSGTDLLGLIASGMGTALAVAPVLQMRLIVRKASSDGVSLGYAVVLLVAMSLWLAYGLVLGSIAIVVPNLVSVIVSTALIATIWRYRPALDDRARHDCAAQELSRTPRHATVSSAEQPQAAA